jgi:hypothetical protein
MFCRGHSYTTKIFIEIGKTQILIVPKCISSHLRSCTLIYKGFIGEIQLAKYILKHAPLLRVMKITFAESSSSQDTLKELKSCPRISSECELSITFT